MHIKTHAWDFVCINAYCLLQHVKNIWREKSVHPAESVISLLKSFGNHGNHAVVDVACPSAQIFGFVQVD